MDTEDVIAMDGATLLRWFGMVVVILASLIFIIQWLTPKLRKLFCNNTQCSNSQPVVEENQSAEDTTEDEEPLEADVTQGDERTGETETEEKNEEEKNEEEKNEEKVDVKTGEEEKNEEEKREENKELESNRTSNITDVYNANKDQTDPTAASSGGSSSAETGVVKSMTTRAFHANQSPSSTGTKSQVTTKTTGKRGRVRGPIKEPDRTTLNKNIPTLLEIITEPDRILQSLCSRDVFDKTDREMVEKEIKNCNIRNGIALLLNLLLDCGSDAFQLFGDCLQEHNYNEALELLGFNGEGGTVEAVKKLENKTKEEQKKEETASSRGSSSAEIGLVKLMSTRAHQAKQSPSSSTETKPRRSQVTTKTAGTRERERGPIKEPDRKILREKTPALINSLKDPKLLITSLIARGVFDDDDKEKVERELHKVGTRAGMTKLLEILKDCGSDALQLFMECLKDNNCIPALKLLESAISKDEIGDNDVDGEQTRQDIFPGEERTGEAVKKPENKTKEKNEEEKKEEKGEERTGEAVKKLENKTKRRKGESFISRLFKC